MEDSPESGRLQRHAEVRPTGPGDQEGALSAWRQEGTFCLGHACSGGASLSVPCCLYLRWFPSDPKWYSKLRLEPHAFVYNIQHLGIEIGPGTSLAVQQLRLCISTSGSGGLIPRGRTKIPPAVWRRLSTEELMLSNCGAWEDSWESLGQWGNQTSQS